MKTKSANGTPLTPASMAVTAFAGIGTGVRHEGQDFIVVAKDERALELFWRSFGDRSVRADKTRYKKSVVISADNL